MDINMEVTLELVQGGITFTMAVNRFENVRDIKEKVQNLYHIPISCQTFFFNDQPLQDDLRVWQSEIHTGSRIVLVVAADALNNDLICCPYLPLQLPMPQFSHRTPMLPMPSRTPVMPMQHMPSDMMTWEESPAQFPSSSQLIQLEKRRRTDPMPHMASWSNIIDELEESRMVTLMLKEPNYWKDRIPIEADLDDTVLKLKKKILACLKTLSGFRMENVTVEMMVLHSHSTRVELLDHLLLQDCALSENHEIDLSIKK